MAIELKQIVRIRNFSGLLTLLLLGVLVLCPLLAVGLKAQGPTELTGADWRAVRFTVVQAVLSAFLSIALAIPVARALARRKFAGRQILVSLLGAPFLLPVIVAVLGLLAVWGRSGFVSQLLMAAGSERISIYGLSGILLAHVFFNLPIVTRLILQGWGHIPAEHFRLAAQLGMRPNDVWNMLEKPMLRSVLPGAFLLVFLLCITSFAVALALGGGPKSTTIELAIYQALRFEFALGKAATLGLVQLAICAVIAFLSLRFAKHVNLGVSSSGSVARWDLQSWWLVQQDRVSIVLIAAFLGAPLLAILWRGGPHLFDLPSTIWPAIANSLIVAGFSAVISITLAFSLAVFIQRSRNNRPRLSAFSEGMGLLTLAVSPFVLGTGMFILIHPVANPFTFALPVTALVNATIGLPLALRAFLLAIRKSEESFGNLADNLGITGFDRFRVVTWPLIRQPAGFSVGLVAALSMGDLGVITLFAPPDVETLPLLMYRLMGAYRMEDAAGVALILIAISFSLFWLFDQGGRHGDNA